MFNHIRVFTIGCRLSAFGFLLCLNAAGALAAGNADRAAKHLSHPRHIVLVMSDDQGWGQMGYYDHPYLKTPNLDAMAANGLRLDRFYAGGPVCSPTRASVLTGRTHDRTGVYSHGYALRHQERTLAEAMRDAGYATGHFGKWHLNGLRGPGAPVLASDSHHPGTFGFERWLSVTNFFDINPIMSRGGDFEEFRGDSSEIVVAEALEFIDQQRELDRPSFTVIWYGSPHSPFHAAVDDSEDFTNLNEKGRQHHGELVAMDRSIGALRSGLKGMGIADNTLVWFNSDNGGLPGVGCDSVGGLRGFKGSVYEGGLRVPAIIEWPAVIQSRITEYPAGVIDIFPTIADLVGLPLSSMGNPIDGVSLVPLFTNDLARREKPLPFHYQSKTVLIDNDFKIIFDEKKDTTELYNLKADPHESTNVAKTEPQKAAEMKRQAIAFNQSIAESNAGKDYREGKLIRDDPGSRFWVKDPAYEPYLDQLLSRPEYHQEAKR